MKIEKDDNLLGGYRIFGSNNNWDVEEGRLCICVSNCDILPLSKDDMIINAYGDGPQQIAEDIIELSRKAGREELDMLKAENESLKETIEVLQRQLEKEKDKREDMIEAFKSELEQAKKELKGADNDKDALDARTYAILPIKEHNKADPELYTAMKILISRHNETLMENNRLRKRNNKLKQDFESVKGHLRCAQYKIDKYERDKHYSEIFIDNHPGQSLTFKNAKVSVSDNGDVTVSGGSVTNLLSRLDQLCEIEKIFKGWQDIVLKRLNKHIKEN